MRRREFLKSSVVAGAAGILTGHVAESGPLRANRPQPEGRVMPIVDTHVHLWDLTRFNLPWLQKDTPLARSFVIKDYQTAIDGLNVVKGVYMEVDVEPRQHVAEAEYHPGNYETHTVIAA
jgi:L-fuconolactonase